MDRLICGDVGFGKTEVAVRAAFKAGHGRQTSGRAGADHRLGSHTSRYSGSAWLDYRCGIEMLQAVSVRNRKEESIAAFTPRVSNIVIGTHRLISGESYLKTSHWWLIDEEHVSECCTRKNSKSFSSWSMWLTLSATPIPRTLYFRL